MDFLQSRLMLMQIESPSNPNDRKMNHHQIQMIVKWITIKSKRSSVGGKGANNPAFPVLGGYMAIHNPFSTYPTGWPPQLPTAHLQLFINYPQILEIIINKK